MPDIPEPPPAKRPLLAARNGEPSIATTPVVCIGLAVGGLRAIRPFIGAIASQSTIAFVISYQAETWTKHQLAELLRPETSMPIRDVQHGATLAGNAIYLVPDAARMVLVGDRLVNFADDEDDLAVPPLDLLLHSLAVSAGSRATALLLSGSDHDGVRGAVSIRRVGGLVLAEDPKNAENPDRPRAVIEAGLASAHVSPEAMPSLIDQFLRDGNIDPCIEESDVRDDRALRSIIGLLDERSGLNLDAYRKSVVVRRIRRRASLVNVEALHDYVALLKEDDREIELLHDDLMVGVTSFFGDPDAFGVLTSKVLPVLTKQSPSDQPIRIWVPACSTGEEAYSLAMLITDDLIKHDLERGLEIVATDRSRRLLEVAELGLYTRDQLLCLPSDFRSRYMEPAGDQFRVCEALRDLVTFVQHDLLDDEPLVGMDLVSCRNFLSNLTEKAQTTALSNCRHALAATGFLFLGPSEIPGSFVDGLSVVDRRWRIFRKATLRHSDPAIEHLSGAYKEQPAETIQPPQDINPHPNQRYPTHDAYDDQSGVFDGLMEQNQQMLESTIDTLLASNDALRRRNRDLRTENQRLVATNAALDDLATMVAHDLKAPLSAVDDMARRLAADLENATHADRQQDYLHQIQFRVLRLRWLVDDLLAYARHHPEHEIDLEEVELGDLIREVLELIGLPPGFKLEVRPPSMAVKTRRAPLACILRNLLANAIEHHGCTKGHIHIAMSTSDNALDIRIIDDGRGHGHQREPLGIAIVRQLLSAEGGHLDLAPRDDNSGREARMIWPVEQP